MPYPTGVGIRPVAVVMAAQAVPPPRLVPSSAVAIRTLVPGGGGLFRATDSGSYRLSVTSAPAASDREAFAPIDWALFIAVGIIWGASYLFIMIGLDSFHPGLITWARIVLGAVTLVLLGATRTKVDKADRSRVVLLSVVWVTVPFTLFPLAEQHINSAATGLLTGATPFFTGVFGALWFDRVPGRLQKIATAVGFAGIALIATGSSAEGGTAPAGVVMVLAATVCYGLATNMAGPLQRKYGAVPVMGQMLLWASLWTLPFGVFGLSRSTFAMAPALATAALGVFGTGLAFAFMASLIGRVGGHRASFITYANPIVALALGAVILDERVAPLALVGVLLVLAAALIGSRAEH